MAATQTAIALARGLVDTINMRAQATVASASFDSNGDALVTLQVSTGNHSIKALVRIKPVSTNNVDALGLAQRVVRPHVAQVLFDSNASGATLTQKGYCLSEAFKWGTKVEWYEVDAVAIATTDIASANLKTSVDPLPGRDNDAI